MSYNDGFDYFLKNTNKIYRYYRTTLTTKEQIAYDKITQGLMSFSSSIAISGVDAQQIKDIYQKIVHDNSFLFYVEHVTSSRTLFFNNTSLVPKYRFDKKKANDTLLAVIKKAKEIMNGCENESETQKEKRIHDYFCTNIVYDDAFADSSYECVGPLLFGKGVCEGISKAAKLLFDIAGIQSMVLHGESTQEQFASVAKDNLHAWNMVRVGGAFYHLDITFDLTIKTHGITRYDYFNLSDEEIQKDHKLTIKNMPVCTNSANYYTAESMYMNTTNDYKNYLAHCLKKGGKDIVFKLPFTKSVDDSLEKIAQITEKTLLLNGQIGANYTITYNEFQRVFQVNL